jgi:hypothetical protein
MSSMRVDIAGGLWRKVHRSTSTDRDHMGSGAKAKRLGVARSTFPLLFTSQHINFIYVLH